MGHQLYENFGLANDQAQENAMASSGATSSPYSPPLDNIEWAGTLSSERRRQLADVIVELKGGSYRDEPSPILRSEEEVMEHVELIDPQGIGQGINVMDPAYNAVYQT